MNVFFEALKVAANGLVLEDVSEEISAKRYSVCLGCDKRKSETDQCGICNCFLQIKSGAKNNINPLRARTEITHCPLGRWDDKEIANHYRELDGKPPLP